MRKSRNPTVGEHPDLFERSPTRVVRALDMMSGEEIRALPRSAFSQAEWDSLDEETRSYIDPEDARTSREKRIDEFVAHFVQYHEQLIEGEASADLFDGDFDYYFSEYANKIIERARDAGFDSEVDEIESRFEEAGFSPEQIEEALKEALQDNNNYDYDYDANEYGRAMFKAHSSESFYVDRDTLDEWMEGLSEDEIEEAVKQINKKTDLYIKPSDLEGKYEFSVEEYVDRYADANPDWEKVEAAVSEILGEQEPIEELEQGPEADQVLMNFPDGSYVRTLRASELPAEGKAMGICVGRAEYGYAKAVKANRTMILSLRRPSGKPLLTFEVSLEPKQGRPLEVVQIKGKANRLPGWDLGRVGQGEVKADEVKKAVEVVELLALDPKDVRDLEPGLRALKGLPPRRENHGVGEHCGFCREAS